MGVSIYNAGGGVAKNLAILLIGEDKYAMQNESFLRPGETVTFGSQIRATDEARAIAYARSQDGRDLVWDHEGVRREIKRVPHEWPVWKTLFETFYPTDDLSGHEPTNLLRGDNRLY
jgi:hypothetical protein